MRSLTVIIEERNVFYGGRNANPCRNKKAASVTRPKIIMEKQQSVARIALFWSSEEPNDKSDKREDDNEKYPEEF